MPSTQLMVNKWWLLFFFGQSSRNSMFWWNYRLKIHKVGSLLNSLLIITAGVSWSLLCQTSLYTCVSLNPQILKWGNGNTGAPPPRPLLPGCGSQKQSLTPNLADSKARKALPGALLLLSSALLCPQEESRSDHQASAGKDFLTVWKPRNTCRLLTKGHYDPRKASLLNSTHAVFLKHWGAGLIASGSPEQLKKKAKTLPPWNPS